MKDVTNELSQFERGLLFYNCDLGVLRKGENHNTYHRRFSSERMTSNGETYYRTGEIEIDDEGSYYIVYRLKSAFPINK